MTADFSPEQKRFLEGFLSGVQATRALSGATIAATESTPTGPEAAHTAAQRATEARGGKLVTAIAALQTNEAATPCTRERQQNDQGDLRREHGQLRHRRQFVEL